MTSTSFLFRPPHVYPAVIEVGIDGDLMACGGRDGHINIFSLTRGTHILGLEFHSPISALHWDNPTASMNKANKLFVGMKDGTVERLVFSVGPDGGCSNACFVLYHLCAAYILDWWTQRKSNAEVNGKSSVPPTTEELNPTMNQRGTFSGWGPTMKLFREIIQTQGKQSSIALLCLSHGWRSVPPYSFRRSSRKRPEKIAKTTNERGKAGRRRTLGYVYSDEEPDAFDQT
ncbi:hypothetical protein B0H13DRAFT_1888597 [Mycena leptocephala]|nr:hypothetical protein B0H13DRAFT_1888597 [Mycena leptocephala]